MQVKKMMAKCVNEMSKILAKADRGKSLPFWTYEEPVPKEVKLWLELNQSKEQTE